MGITAPNGIQAITKDFPTVDEKTLSSLNQAIFENDFTGILAILELNDAEAGYVKFNLLKEAEILIQAAIAASSNGVCDKFRGVLELISDYRARNKAAYDTYLEASAHHGEVTKVGKPPVAIVSKQATDRVGLLLTESDSDVDKTAQSKHILGQKSQIIAQQLEDFRRLLNNAAHEFRNLLSIVPMEIISEIAEFNSLLALVTSSEGFPDEQSKSDYMQIEAVLAATAPNEGSFREAFKASHSLEARMPHLIQNLQELAEKIRTKFREARHRDLGRLQKTPALNFDYMFKSVNSEDDTLLSWIKNLKRQYNHEYLVERYQLQTQARHLIDGSCFDDNFDGQFKAILKQISDLDAKYREEISLLKDAYTLRPVPFAQQVLTKTAPEQLQIPEKSTPETTRSIFGAKFIRWASGLVAAGAIATGAYALSNNTSNDSEPEQVELANNSADDNLTTPTTYPGATNPATPDQQTEPEQTQAQDDTEEAEAQTQALRSPRRLIVEAGANLPESQIAFRLPTSSFDAFDIISIEAAISGFSNNAVHTLRSDIQGPTEFVVATINDRHIVRSSTGRVTSLRLNKGETFWATPLKDEHGNQMYGHLAGIGYMPLAQLEGTNNVIFLSPYTQTITQTAVIDITPELDQQDSITFDDAESETASNDYTPDPSQSLEDFIQDLFADELDSQPTPGSDPELASMIDQSADQIQMPDTEPVIPEWYYASRSQQAIETEDDQVDFVVEDSDILSAEDLYEEVDDSDIIDEEFVLDETDLEEVFAVDSIEDVVALLDPEDLEMEQVGGPNSPTFQAEVIPPKPMQQPEQAKGFFGRAKSLVKGLFRS